VGASIVHCTKLGAEGLHLLAKDVFSGITFLKFECFPPKKVGIKEGFKLFVFTLREVPCRITEFLYDIMLSFLIEEGFGQGTEFL